ncbi:hypothetical protein D3C72_2572150 [compost metagenome]
MPRVVDRMAAVDRRDVDLAILGRSQRLVEALALVLVDDDFQLAAAVDVVAADDV